MNELSHWWELIVSAFGSFIGAIGGVLLRRSHKAAQGANDAWSRIWLDGPTVFVMGLVGAAVGSYLHSAYSMPELFGHMLSAVLGYLGPAALDRIALIIERRAAGDDK